MFNCNFFHRCWSSIGRQGGKQDLSIGTGCAYKGSVLHEIMHAMGFFHENTRQDRKPNYLDENTGPENNHMFSMNLYNLYKFMSPRNLVVSIINSK